MRSKSTSKLPSLEQPAALSQELKRVSQIAGALLYATMIASQWAVSWRFPLLGLLAVASGVGNQRMSALAGRIGFARSEDARLVFNVVHLLVVGWVSAFSTLWWLFLPYLVGISNGATRDTDWRRVGGMLAVLNAGALAGGGDPWLAVAATGMSCFLHAIVGAHLAVTEDLLRQNELFLSEVVKATETLSAAQAALVGQEKLASVGLLSAGVAHEINNPMCFVTANVHSLLEDLKLEDQLSPLLVEYRDEILPETLSGIARVNSIVSDLRRFARGEPEPFLAFNLSAEVEAAVRMARTQLKSGQELKSEIPPNLEMMGQSRQIGQVMLNLIINALQALRGTGEVKVSAELTAKGPVIEVRDTGTGMSAQVLEKIFQPFFTTKSVGEGTGMGLAVVHGIVHAHGGRIEVESAPGEGSCFRVILPAIGTVSAVPAPTDAPRLVA